DAASDSSVHSAISASAAPLGKSMRRIQRLDCTFHRPRERLLMMRFSAPNPGIDHDACGVGFVARLGGTPSRDVVERALIALARLSHRGGVDSDGLSGDGAGLLLPISKEFFRRRAQDNGFDLS